MSARDNVQSELMSFVGGDDDLCRKRWEELRRMEVFIVRTHKLSATD